MEYKRIGIVRGKPASWKWRWMDVEEGCEERKMDERSVEMIESRAELKG